MNTNKTKQLRRSITASVAAFTFGTCVLSTSYATAAPTGAETLTVEDSAPEPEIFPFYALIGGDEQLVSTGIMLMRSEETRF